MYCPKPQQRKRQEGNEKQMNLGEQFRLPSISGKGSYRSPHKVALTGSFVVFIVAAVAAAIIIATLVPVIMRGIAIGIEPYPENIRVLGEFDRSASQASERFFATGHIPLLPKSLHA